MGPKAIRFAHFWDLPARLLKSVRTLYSDIFINILLDRMRIILSDLNSRRITRGGSPEMARTTAFFGSVKPKAFCQKKL